MKKRMLLSVFLALAVLLFTGCVGEPEPLRVCVDLAHTGTAESSETVIGRFLDYVADLGAVSEGPTDIELELIPNMGAEREAALDRLRTEIMSGGGPDVFIISNTSARTTGENALFPIPEKTMTTGIFLSLDEYMESAQFTDWDKQVSAVMAAGQNEYGQQIIPLSYTLPVTCYRRSEVTADVSKDTTWNEMLADESGILQAAGSWFHSGSAENFTKWEGGYLECVLGELADFESEELLFTEEELLQRTKEILILRDKEYSELPGHYQICLNVGYNRYDQFDDWTDVKKDDALTMIPLYSDDGGITATILSYGAVNANTKRPEDAFFVLDVFLSQAVQRTSDTYGCLTLDVGLPMDEDLLQGEVRNLRVKAWGFTAENYTEFCSVREQITNAGFKGSLEQELQDMFRKCRTAYDNGESMEEIVSESYKNMQRMLAE